MIRLRVFCSLLDTSKNLNPRRLVRQTAFCDPQIPQYSAVLENGFPASQLRLEVFRGILLILRFSVGALVKALKYSDRRRGGRPPHDPVMMFKIMILQALYSLSDDKAALMIRDRLSFMRFLGLSLGDPVPDAKTIWLFRERLKEKDVIERLFERFDRHLEEQGLLAMGGQIMDATIVEAPRQRNSQEEKETIKSGDVPKSWEDNPAKLR